MAKQDINIGVEGNDGTGDSIRESFRKTNENFQELYAVFGVGGQITFTTLSDTPDELTPNTIPLVNDAGTLIQLVTLASNSALGGGATDTITFSYDTAGKLVISSSFTKMSDDLSPTLGGPLDAGGFGIANVGISTIEAERLNTTHDNLSGLTVDDLVITKGYADQRYITSGLPLRVADEPAGKLHYSWVISQYVDDTIEILSHYDVDQALIATGHGLESGANGTAIKFNAEDTDPNNLVSGTTYYLRVVSATRLNLYTEANKQYAVTDVQADADTFKVNPSGAIAADDKHTIVDAALDLTIAGNFLSDTGMPRFSTVRRQGDTMTGNLFLSDHPGELAGEGAPNGPEDLQAATKYYVDNTAYSSPEALFVSTKGDDNMAGVPAGKEGTSLTYAFRTINKAAVRAEELIRSAAKEPGNYMQTLTHSSFTKDSVVINADVDVPVFEQARNLLDKNTDYIAAEVVGFINKTFPTFAYNSSTCARDTKLIINAIALDINRGLTANYLTRQAAERYYSGVSARIAITTQLTQTVAGIVAARNIATAILTNDLYNQKNISTITVANIPEVTTTTAHGLVDKDIVVFRDIKGMVELTTNTKKYVKVTGTQTFELYNDKDLTTPFDTSAFTGFTSGIVGQVFQTEEDQFLDLGTVFTITTAGNVTVVAGETLTQAGSGATGVVQASVTNGTTIKLETTTGTFNTGNNFTGSVSGALGPDSVPTVIANDFDADANAIAAIQDKFNLVNTIIQSGLDSGGDIVYGSTYKIVVTNGAASYADQTNPNNTDALPGKVIRGKRSEAIGQIVSFTNDVGAESATDPQTGLNEPGPTVFQVHLLGAKDFEPEEPLEYGNFVAKKQVTIMVETGIYEEDYPIRLSNNVSLKGDEFRRVIIKPKTETDSRVPRVSQSKWANLYFYRDNEFDGLTINNGGTEFFNQDGVSQGKFGYHYLSEAGKELNSGPTVTNVGNFTSAANIINENKDYLIEETIQYIQKNHVDVTFVYDEAKCRRDSAIILEGLGYDVAFGTNYNAVTNGLAYQRANSAYVISNQITATVNAIKFLRNGARALAQAGGGNSTTDTRLVAYFDEITDIIENGAVSTDTSADALTFPVPGALPTTDANDAALQLQANRNFLAAEVVAFVNANSPPAGYDQAKCLRDSKYLVDGLTYDILYGGNYASRIVAESYFEGAVAQLPVAQQAKTVLAYQHISTVIGNVVQAISVTPTTGNTETQDTTNAPAAPTEATQLDTLITIVTDVITANNISGLPAEVFPDITNETTAEQAVKAAVDAGSSTLIDNTIDFIDKAYVNFTYSREKCRRDTGLIIDGIVADLTKGGEVSALEIQGSYQTLIGGDSNYLTQVGYQETATEMAILNLATLSNALLSGTAPNFNSTNYDAGTSTLTLTGNVSVTAGETITQALSGATGVVINTVAAGATIELKTVTGTFNQISRLTGSVAGELGSNSIPTVVVQLTPDLTYGSGESGTAAVVGQLIDKIVFAFDEDFNPPKRNDALDVFLMSDATIIRNVTVQGHGGFMCVLDPQGQVLTKSPYIQTASSFSKSINKKTFAGGMYVDAYVGNLPTRVTGQPQTANRFKLTVQSDVGEGLRLRPPELPCPFYVEGKRFQVNAISDYDQGQGTATIYLDANSNKGNGYDVEEFDDSSVERDIFLQTAGNRSMLANDFTQINDLGYGLIANNAAFSEQVSTFTYYCQTAMYANNGSEIRGLNCSNGYGNFGLIAEGADPNEIPDQVTLKNDMVQPAKAFTTAVYTNAFDDPSITLTDFKTPPSANSLITIDHGGATGTLNYVISTVTNLSDTDGDGTVGESGDVVVTGLSTIDAVSVNITTDASQQATYDDLSQSSTTGSGSGAKFTVVLDHAGSPNAAVITVDAVGTGYTVGETITITGDILGAASPANDLTFDVGTIFGTAAGVLSNNVYKLDLKADDVSTDDFFGTLQATVNANTIIEYRDSFNFIFDNVGDATALVTRPSTAINFDESDNTTYRSIAFSNKDSFSQDLPADEILTTFEVGFDFVQLNVKTDQLGGGYGSAQGDTKLAISQLASSALNIFDDTERLTRDSTVQAGRYPGDASYSATGGMRFVWDGKTHGVTNYTPVAEFTVTGSIGVTAGETITQANTGATGVVHATVTSNIIELETITGTFNTTDQLTGSTSGALGANSVPSTINLTSWSYITFVDIAGTNINSGYGGTGINSAVPATERTLTAGLPVGSTSEITVSISLMRATGHDFTQIGTGSFNDSNYPNVILGDPVNSLADFYTDSETASTAQVWERRKGRVFFVSTDQNGFFRVGKFFSVDQATGDITFAGEIGLSNANALGFKKGVTINEFSADDSFADDSGQATPTEKAIGGYINRVLGFNVKSGAQIGGTGNRIGTGFLPLNGLSPMEGNLNLNSNKIQNLALPASGSDATNKNYVDDNANAFATVKQLRDTTVGTVGQNELLVFSGKQVLYTEPETGGTFSAGDVIQNDPSTPSATGNIIEISTLTDEQFGSIRKIVYTVGTGTFDPDSDTLYNGVAQAVGLTTSLQADVGGPFPEIVNASEATASDINVTVTRTASGTEYDLQIEADAIIDADVNSSAAIAQSKLAMNTAGTRANATGIAQSDLGVATFKDTEFTHTNGFVELQTSSSNATGIAPGKLQHVATDTVLGRSAAGEGAVSAISFDTILSEGGAVRDSELGAFANSGDEVLIRTASNTYSTTEVTTTGENSKIVKTQSDGNIRAQGLILGGADTYEVATTTGTGTTLTLKTPGQAVILNATGTTSASLVTEFPGIIDVGATGQTTESDFHTASSYAGEGFVSTDWLYSNFIEAITERDATSTGIGLGAGGGFTESAANTIVFVTNGTVEATINDSGIQVDDVTSLTTNGDLNLNGNGTGNVNITDSLDVDTITAYSGTNTNLTLNGKGSGVVSVGGGLTVAGTTNLNGAINLGNATGDTITYTGRVDSSIEPDATANNRNLGNASRKWNTVYASVFDGTATSAQYADLAENYLADADYEEGTVLVFGGDDEVTLTNTKGNTRVAGVVSTNPAHLMNSNLEGQHVTAIALQGRVPCKVLGQVAKGDMLVTSAIPGYAIVNNSPGVGQVIGKAVGEKTDEGKGTVEVVVGRV